MYSFDPFNRFDKLTAGKFRVVPRNSRDDRLRKYGIP